MPDDAAAAPAGALALGASADLEEAGKACVFDDSIEHEAWNRNPDQLRVVLIFDVWRPELAAAERDFIGSVLQAVDAYGASAAAETLP